MLHSGPVLFFPSRLAGPKQGVDEWPRPQSGYYAALLSQLFGRLLAHDLRVETSADEVIVLHYAGTYLLPTRDSKYPHMSRERAIS